MGRVFSGIGGGSGGGLFNNGEMSLLYTSVLSNTTGDGSLDQNSGSGGGIYNSDALSLNGVSLVGNRVGQSGTGGFGGGVYLSANSPVTLSNVLAANNTVVPGGLGSGMYIENTSAHLHHTTLAHNTGGDGSGIHAQNADLELINTILVKHTVGISLSTESIVNLNHTLWGSGNWANVLDFDGSGQITHTADLIGNPDFVDPAQGNYHIAPGSDTLDQGIPTTLTTDMDNHPRYQPTRPGCRRVLATHPTLRRNHHRASHWDNFHATEPDGCDHTQYVHTKYLLLLDPPT